ncbi:hypothetical protein Tco_0155307 [Tanacetum coccineum]
MISMTLCLVFPPWRGVTILPEHQSDTQVITVKMEILLEPTSNKLMVVMRMASAAAKPCQGDSSEFYLITDNIYTDQWGTVVFPMMAAARRGRVIFIAACSYATDKSKDIMKAQVHVSRLSPL